MDGVTANDLAGLRSRVETLERFEAVRGLLQEYGRAADRQDLESVVGLFSSDGVFDSPRGTARGSAEIAASYRTAWSDDSALKRHFLALPHLTACDDATVESVTMFHFIGRGAGRSNIGWGVYRDLIDFSTGLPRFRHKTVTIDLATDLVAGWSQED